MHDETQKGTLEQLYLSPAGVVPVFLVRAAIETVYSALLVAVVFLATRLLGAATLAPSPATAAWAIAAVLLALPGVWGLGLALAGFVLLAKKAASLLAVASYGLIALSVVQAWPFGWTSLLPYAAGASAARSALSGGGTPPASWLAVIAAVSAAWLAAGFLAWKAAEKAARARSLFGQY
jgi:ABC-2 type transport system permease protein